MKIKFRFLLALLFISCFVSAQTLVIPAGVTYSYTSEENNTGAKTVLSEELDKTSGLKLFSGTLFIGPKLWKEIKADPVIKTIEGGNTTFRLPVRNARGKVVDYENLKGKLIQNEEDYKKFWSVLNTSLTGAERSFRKLSTKELEYYWSVISWDIVEPIYIMTCNSKNYLFDLDLKDGKYTLQWVDEVD